MTKSVKIGEKEYEIKPLEFGKMREVIPAFASFETVDGKINGQFVDAVSTILLAAFGEQGLTKEILEKSPLNWGDVLQACTDIAVVSGLRQDAPTTGEAKAGQ